MGGGDAHPLRDCAQLITHLPVPQFSKILFLLNAIEKLSQKIVRAPPNMQHLETAGH